jgi:serine/threonine protein kinase
VHNEQHMSTHPSMLGSYPVERELGRGGLGVVYLARDTRLDRSVAIKVLPDLLMLDPDSLARFEREAKLLASLNHPNIATIYGVEDTGQQQLLVLE